MTSSPIRTWRVPVAVDVRHRAWDGEHVFYNGATGDTHRLSEAAAQVLLRLRGAPADEAVLAAHLAEVGDVTPDEAALALDGILRELARLEYVEAA